MTTLFSKLADANRWTCHGGPRWFWAAVNFGLLGLATLAAFTGDDRLTHSPRGIAVGLLVLLYIAVGYISGIRLFPLKTRPTPIRLLAWGTTFAICLLLVLLNDKFILLLWVLFGGSVFYLGMRMGLVATVGVLIVIGAIQADGFYVPHNLDQWGSAAGWLLIGFTWIGIAMTLDRLLRQRAENEELIAELKTSQEQLRQAAAKERELLVLRERERLARDLHDIIGHALVLASVKLEAAQRLNRVDREQATAELTATQQLLRQTMTELRQAVTNLRTGPENIEAPVSLPDQIRIMIDETGIPTVMTLEPIAELNPIQAEAMRRIAQEALTNVVKHAAATEISVSLRRHNDEIELEIADDGRGFGSAAVAATGHFGIRGMHERIALSGGELSVQSTPGTGTRVRATLPLAPLNDRAPYAVPEVISGAA